MTMRSDRLDRLMEKYSPEKTAREIALETGEALRYVQQALRRHDRPTKPDARAWGKRGRPATRNDDGLPWPEVTGSWPSDMKFTDAEGVW